MTKDNGLLVRPCPALQEILKKRLARGDKEEDGRVITKHGSNI